MVTREVSIYTALHDLTWRRHYRLKNLQGSKAKLTRLKNPTLIAAEEARIRRYEQDVRESEAEIRAFIRMHNTQLTEP